MVDATERIRNLVDAFWATPLAGSFADLRTRDDAVTKVEEGAAGEYRARHLIRWYEHGEGAARIAWGTPGDFDRCVVIASEHMSPDHAKGFCANRHHGALGIWPATHAAMERGKKSVNDDVIAKETMSDSEYIAFLANLADYGSISAIRDQAYAELEKMLATTYGTAATVSIEKAYDPAKHPRLPAGMPGGGRFRSIGEAIDHALTLHGEGKGLHPQPLHGIERRHLLDAAKRHGIKVKRGVHESVITEDVLSAVAARAVHADPSAKGYLHHVERRPYSGYSGGPGEDIKYGRHYLGSVHQDSTGLWSARPNWRINRHHTATANTTREDAIKSLVVAHAASLPAPPAPRVRATAPAAPVPQPPAPAEVMAAREVIYGIDPKSRTSARQLAVYGAMRRNHYDHLSAAEQTTLLGDLSYIETTSKSATTKAKAAALLNRFTPAGTPLGSIPSQPIVIPPSSRSDQTRVSDPLGTPGLLKMLSASQRGSSGDGWTRTSSGGTGPWGKYGAAGLMLRHVDSNGTVRYLMVQRGPAISDPGKWQFPGGAKEQKENFYQGAAREVIEELGFKPTDLNDARVHGTHIHEAPNVMVTDAGGRPVPWQYVSVAATVPTQVKPDLSTHHARAETSDAKWMTEAEIDALDSQGKLLSPLAGGKLKSNVMSLFPQQPATPGRPASRTTKPARLLPSRMATGGAPPAQAHKSSKGVNLIPDKAAEDKLRADISKVRKNYRGKTADERLAAIGAMQGFDETPTVLPKSEVDRLLATGDYIEAWRGISGGKGKTAAQIHEEFRSGPAYYGTGIFGNGYYLATQRSIADQYSDRTKNSVVRVLIPKSAKMVSHHDASQKAAQTSSSSFGTYVGRSGDLGGGTLRDEGRYAAAAGFDGIEIPHTARSSGGHAVHIASARHPAYNWVNRSVLIVQEADK